MRIVRTVTEMASLGGGDLGFVPTMGAFHEGHLALMLEARKHHKLVAVSIFVNPLQFGQNEDFDKYPRDEERDFELARTQGVDLLFAPSPQEIYPREGTTIHVPGLSSVWEGAIRPGHFDGVATIVCKLFNIVRPNTAYFGWKDLQQCLVIRRMVEDLNVQTRLSFLVTIREADGLALSSRNAYLSPENRRLAPKIYETLTHLQGCSIEEVDAEIISAREELGAVFKLDYLELVDLVDMKPVREKAEAAFIVAARLGTTRLIDNIRVHLR